ncbi:hypothetical protein T492DRAFT_920247 [Pavlovales sp. CCMP2436]|nr:hypothetical protein T492DRAFT_920247 [Pavlovales sp. CCMP2436]
MLRAIWFQLALVTLALHAGRTLAHSMTTEAVVITCHGRSESTLTERIELLEPLRPWDNCFNHMHRAKSLMDSTIAMLNFSAPVLQKCPWHNKLGVHPLMPRADGKKREPHIEQLRAINASVSACSERIAAARGMIAVKLIRIPGLLHLLEDQPRGLMPAGRRLFVLHLIRDPRALLHSRNRVGWGQPLKLLKNGFAKWAGTICSQTLKDMNAVDALMARGGDNGVLYIRVLYEDLVQSPIATLDRLYGLLGRSVPPAVANLFRRHVPGIVRGQRGLQADRQVKKGTQWERH